MSNFSKKEAIKGQDALKLTVEKLEAEIFKDWPTNSIGVEAHGGFMINRNIGITITDCGFTPLDRLPAHVVT